MIGFYIVKGDGSVQYSPTFPRGGLAATFLVDVLQRVGSTPVLTITIEHKNADDTSFTVAATFSTISAVGVASMAATGLKEQIRLGYQMTTGTNQWEGYLINPLAPAWRPY